MEEWKQYRLGDFMEFNPKISLKKETVARKITMDQLVPHSRDIYSWTYEPYSGGAKFQNGDTIMARITPCLENGKHAFISLLDENEIAYGSTEYIVIRGRKGISDNLFVYYLTHFPSFKDAAIKSMVGTSGRQRAQVDVLENMTMKLPSIAEQKSIADILTKLDDKIAVNKQINDNFYFAFLEVMLIWLLTSHRNDNLEQQAQALFKSWFVDFDPFKDGEFLESELGMIPKGWRVESLGNVCKCLLGGTPSRNKEDYWNGDIAWINSGEVNEFRITKPSEYITEEGLNNSATKLLPRKTTVLAITGATLGQVSLLEIDTCANQSVIGVLENEILPYEYIYPLINDRISELCSHMTGGAQQHINKNNVEELSIIVPPSDVIERYKEKTSPIYNLIGNNCIETQKITSLRDSLLPKLMSGEVKVNEVNM